MKNEKIYFHYAVLYDLKKEFVLESNKTDLKRLFGSFSCPQDIKKIMLTFSEH